METLYKLQKKWPNERIKEINAVKVSDSFYWDEKGKKNGLDTNWDAIFKTKQEAVDYMNDLFKKKISRAEESLKTLIKNCELFNSINE